MREELVTALDEALGLGDTMVIVRSPSAVAEVAGGRLHRGDEWLTLGDEGPGNSHVHVRMADIRALRFRQTEGRNAALDVVGPDGGVVLSLSFRKTNPNRGDGFDAPRLAAVSALCARFSEAGA